MIEKTSHSGRRLSHKRSSLGSEHDGSGRNSSNSLTSKNGNNQESARKSKGRSRSLISRHVTSKILGPTIGDTLIGTIEFAGPLLNSVASRRRGVPKERRSSQGSSAEYHGRTVSSADSFERKTKEKHPERATRSRGPRDAAVDQLRMLLSPRLDDVILETAAICCCCCRSKMAERLEEDVKQWKQELKEEREGGKKPRESTESKKRRREGSKLRGKEDESLQGMDEERKEEAENRGSPRKSTASRPSGGELTTPSETLMENGSLNIVAPSTAIIPKEEEPPKVDEDKITKEPNEQQSGPPQRMSIGVQMSGDETFLAQIDLTRRNVSTMDKMSQTDEQDSIMPITVISGEPEKENSCENQSENQQVVTSTPVVRKPSKNKKKPAEDMPLEAPPEYSRDVETVMHISRDLVETIALQARAIGGALELGTSLLPKENAASGEAFSPVVYGSRGCGAHTPRGWQQPHSLPETRSSNRIQNSTMNETAARLTRRKPCAAGRIRSRVDYPTESPIQRRQLSIRSRSSMVSIPSHPTSQERKPTCGMTSQVNSGGKYQTPRNDLSIGGKTSIPCFRASIEEGPLGSSSLHYSSYMEEEHYTDNESGGKLPCNEKTAELTGEPSHKIQMIVEQRVKQSMEKRTRSRINESEVLNDLPGQNYSTPCSTRQNWLPQCVNEVRNGQDIASDKCVQSSDRKPSVPTDPGRTLSRHNQNSSLRWASDNNSPVRSPHKPSLKMATNKRRDNKCDRSTWPFENRVSIPRLSSIRIPFLENSDSASISEEYRSRDEVCHGSQIKEPIERESYHKSQPQGELLTQPIGNEMSSEDPRVKRYSLTTDSKPSNHTIPIEGEMKSLKEKTRTETENTEVIRQPTDENHSLQLEEGECTTEFIEQVTTYSDSRVEDRRISSEERCPQHSAQNVSSDISEKRFYENDVNSPNQSNTNGIKMNNEEKCIWDEEHKDNENTRGAQDKKELSPSRKAIEKKNDKERKKMSDEPSGGRHFSNKNDPSEEECKNAREMPIPRALPISTCFEPRCSDAGLAREDDYIVSRGHTTLEMNLTEVEAVPSLYGKTAKVITKTKKITEENNMEISDRMPSGEVFVQGAEVKNVVEECPEPPKRRNSFLEMLRKKASKKTSEVGLASVGTLCATIEEEESVKTKSTVVEGDTLEKITTLEKGMRTDTKLTRHSNVRFDGEPACLEAPKVGSVWNVESGEKIPENASETSLRFPVRDQSGHMVGVREMDLAPCRSARRGGREPQVEEKRANESRPSIKACRSTFDQGGEMDPQRTASVGADSRGDSLEKRLRRRPRRESASGQRSARVLWAIARINDYGGGERTLEIVETDEKRPETMGRERESVKEVIVFAPASERVQRNVTSIDSRPRRESCI